MKSIFVLALLTSVLTLACTRACRDGTVFVEIHYEGAAAYQPGVKIWTQLLVSPSPSPRSFLLIHPVASPSAVGTLEIDFPDHYPRGATLNVGVSQLRADLIWSPPVWTPVKLSSSCERVTLTVGGNLDLGSHDLTGEDLSRQPVDMGADQGPSALQCKGTVGFPDPPLAISPTCLNIGHVELADVYGNGKPALVGSVVGGVQSLTDCLSVNTSSINVYPNQGGTFAAPLSYATDNTVVAFAFGDFNGDGKLDLVTTGNNDDIAVLINKGDGTYGGFETYGMVSTATSIAVGPLDPSLRDSVVASNNFTQASTVGVSVFQNLGDGMFPSPAPEWPIAMDGADVGNSVGVADFTGDGVDDIVVTNHDTNQLFLLITRGAATFQWPSPFPVGTGPAFLVVGDVNGDGWPDVATASASDGTVSVLINDQSGGFLPRHVYPTSGVYLQLGDIDGDGFADLLASGKSVISVLRNRGDGTFLPEVLYSAAGESTNDFAIADIDGDGKPDLVVNNTGGLYNGNLAILHNYGAGKFNSNATAASAQATYPTGQGPLSVAIGDVTGDGKLDVVVANETSNDLSLLAGNGDGTFASPVPLPVGKTPRSVALGDLSGDGALDIAVANFGDDSVGVLTNDGHGHFGAQTPLAVGLGPSWVVIGDLDGKNGLDIAVANSNDNNFGVLLARSGSGFAGPATYGSGPHTNAIAVAHFYEGDALPAIVSSNGAVARNNGDGTFAVSTPQYPIAGGLSIAAGPITSTSDNVLIGETVSSGQGYVHILFPNGPDEDDIANTAADGIAVADFNRDGKLDFVVGNSLDNTVRLLYLDAATGNTFVPAGTWGVGQTPRALAAGDLDGDGRPDVVVANHDSNTISVLLNRCLP